MLTRPGHARRQLLIKTAQSALLYLPLMRMFRESEARADEASTPNAVFAYWPTGYCGQFWPSGDSAISNVLKPIEDAGFKDQFILMDGLKLYGSYDHNGGLTQTLAGWGGAGLIEGIGKKYQGGEIHGSGDIRLSDLDPRPYSLDQMLADKWKTPSMNVGVATRKCAFYTALSWKNGGVENFSNDNPKDVFDKWFGNFKSDGGSTTQADAAKKIANAEKRMIDFLKNDLKKIESALGAQDKLQFQAHVAAIDDIEVDINKIINGTGAVASPICTPDTISQLFGTVSGEWYYKTENLAKVFAINRALVVQALACNLTRVALYQMGTGHVEGTQLCPEGVNPLSNYDFHTISHDHGDQYAAIQRGHINEITKIATDLKNLKVGTGTLLDKTLIYGATDSGVTGHVPDRTPAFFLGNLGGQFKSGKKVKLNNKPYNHALITMAQLVGASDIKTIGTPKFTGTITEITG